MFSARASAKSKRPRNPPPSNFELSAVARRSPLPPRTLCFSPRFSSSPANPPPPSLPRPRRGARDRLGAMRPVKRGRCCQTDLTGKNTLSNPLMSGRIKGEQRPGCCSQGSAKAAVTPEQRRRRDCRGRRCPLGNLPGNL